ncbi:MAG: 2-acyl-glycerophospho-ethanolamine acyltransferase [Pirellulaceae bacterium]|nr:MAG: 2-acyl-glycerophospho-ethanolamine acyltransferase [Pirellulaceae bacterium]
MQRAKSAQKTPAWHSVVQALWHNAQHAPHRPAIAVAAHEGEEAAAWTWADLAAAVAALVEQWRDEGIVQGDRIVTALPNSLGWVVRDLACHTLGAIHVTLDARLATTAIQRLIDRVEPRAALVGNEDDVAAVTADWRHAGRLQPWRAREMARLSRLISPDAPASLLFTSGSSGEPKGVVLSHRNLLASAVAKLDASPQSGDDVRLTVLPFAHAFARTCELSTWLLTSGRLVLCCNWEELLAHASVWQPTILNLVPYLAEQLADVLDDEPTRLGRRLRMLNVGGAAVSERLFARLQAHGLAPVQGYGLTEAAPCVCANRFGSQRPGVIGPPVLNTEIRLSEDGELWVRGPQVMLGYWRDPRATSETIVDGWLRTGDLADVDSAGDYRIMGRRSERFKLSTGLFVDPAAIEQQLLKDPWIEQAVVVGENQPSITAWIWPAWERLPAVWRKRSAIGETMFDAHRLAQALRNRMQIDAEHWPHYWIPRHIQLLPRRLSQEDGLLTAKGTPRRPQIAAWLQTLSPAHVSSGEA